MTFHATITNIALNRLRAATGVAGILESGLASNKLSRENALRMIAFCNLVVTQAPNQKEEERLWVTLRQGLARIAFILQEHDPLGLKDELRAHLPEEMFTQQPRHHDNP